MSEFVTVIKESRGVKGFVAAEVLTDDNGADGYTTGTPFPVAGVSEIAKTRDSASEAHFYNNIPAIVIVGESPDNITINASLIPLDILAKITGQKYDVTTGTLIECERKVKYFAIGYITEDTAGAEVYVWRLKGTFNLPGETNITKNDGTDATGQEVVYTGVQTVHKFTNNDNRGARAVSVEKAKGLVDLTNFFDSVQTPDTIAASGGGGMYEEMLRGLIEATINNLVIPDGTQEIRDYAFYYLGPLQTVTIPDSVTLIGYAAFEGCDGLIGITIPDSVTVIKDTAFKGCNAMMNLRLSNNLTRIEAFTFEGCSWLAELTIPDGVAIIYDYAFRNCRGLQTVVLPASIEYMGDDPFDGCARIENIYCGFSEGAVSGAPWGATNATIIYDYTPT